MERAEKIIPIDMDVWQAASERWDSIAKPLGSFGVLEEMICRIAAVQGRPDVDISRRCAVVMCGDHGVVAEGVTQCGSNVTADTVVYFRYGGIGNRHWAQATVGQLLAGNVTLTFN